MENLNFDSLLGSGLSERGAFVGDCYIVEDLFDNAGDAFTEDVCEEFFLIFYCCDDMSF